MFNFMNERNKTGSKLRIGNVGRSCLTCKHSTTPYELSRDGMWPLTQYFIQCTVPVSDDLSKIMPHCFQRASAIEIGYFDNKKKEKIYLDTGKDCPAFEQA